LFNLVMGAALPIAEWGRWTLLCFVKRDAAMR
jgi:hypothetical protein